MAGIASGNEVPLPHRKLESLVDPRDVTVRHGEVTGLIGSKDGFYQLAGQGAYRSGSGVGHGLSLLCFSIELGHEVRDDLSHSTAFASTAAPS